MADKEARGLADLTPSKADKGTACLADLLVVNVGNTHTRWVCFAGDRRVAEGRVTTGEIPADLPADLPIALVSVVPDAARALVAALPGREVFHVNAEAALGLKIAYDPPGALGADRLANAYALYTRFGHGLAIDFGTATTLTAVAAGGVLVGGAIMPGLATAMASLRRGTAQLPEVPVVALDARWGSSTVESIQLGVVQGQAGAVTHLAARMLAGLPAGAPVVITGGWSELMVNLLPEGYQREPDWTLLGAMAMYRCNTRGSG